MIKTAVVDRDAAANIGPFEVDRVAENHSDVVGLDAPVNRQALERQAGHHLLAHPLQQRHVATITRGVAVGCIGDLAQFWDRPISKWRGRDVLDVAFDSGDRRRQVGGRHRMLWIVVARVGAENGAGFQCVGALDQQRILVRRFGEQDIPAHHAGFAACQRIHELRMDLSRPRPSPELVQRTVIDAGDDQPFVRWRVGPGTQHRELILGAVIEPFAERRLGQTESGSDANDRWYYLPAEEIGCSLFHAGDRLGKAR